MFRKYYRSQAMLLMALYMLFAGVHAAEVEVVGKHARADGSIHDFEVLDGDALSPGDRFQILLNADKPLYYAVLYFSRDGEAAQIFPQAGKIGQVSAGKQRYIPGVDNFFTLDTNGGRELMFVVTSPSGLSNLRSVLRGVAPIAAQGTPAEIHAYLQKRLANVQKLEITNTGKRIASTTDSISSSLSRDIAAIYARNPWPATTAADAYEQERIRRGDDNSIPEAVRQRASEVRSLLKRPRGTSGSSSLRTVQVSPSQSATPASGSIRRGSDYADSLREQKSKQADEERLRQQQLAAEEQQRQQEMESARLARVAAEEEARRLQAEREEAERLEAQRAAEAEAQTRELEAKRLAMIRAEEEAERQAALRAEKERELAEQKRLEEEQIARSQAEEEARRLAEERAEAERKEAERIALAAAETQKQRLAREKAEAEEQARRKEQQRLAAEQARLEEQQRLATQAAAEAERKREAEQLAAEEAARLEEERQALADAEAEAIRIQQERLRAEEERRKMAEAEAEAKSLAELRAAEETEKQAEESRRQAEIAAEDARIRAEQQALEEKLRQQQLAEEQAAAEEQQQDKPGLLGQMMAFVSGDAKDEKPAESAENTDRDRMVVEIDSSGEEVDLNEGRASAPVEFNNDAAEAPAGAVVVLQAPPREISKPLTAPAPERMIIENGQSAANQAVSGDSYASVASAIVSISTSNDPQAAGFILDNKGHILTGWHVINGVSDIDVSFMGVSGASRSYKASLVKYDKFRDLALLKLINAPEGIQPITVAANELPDAGSSVRVFGQKDGKVWATDQAVITRIAPHFTWFSSDNVIHRGEVLQVDLPPEGKEIGSLVTTMDYQMLGVKSFSGSQTGRTYAVSVRMIREFIASRGKVQAEAGN
jgi:S1-C subfamily serine protease